MSSNSTATQPAKPSPTPDPPIEDCLVFFNSIYPTLLGSSGAKLRIKDCCTSPALRCKSGWLTEINLSNQGLRGTIPSSLTRLTNLDKLRLQQNSLTGKIPPQLGQLTTLTLLELASNQLEGSFPRDLGTLSYLEYLGLNSNSLNGEIPTEIGNLAALQYLDMGNNQFSGQLPIQMGKLLKMIELTIGDNLSGTIPKELGMMKDLTKFKLKGNFVGGVPPEIQSLPNYKSGINSGEFEFQLGNAPTTTPTTTPSSNSNSTLIIIGAVAVGVFVLLFIAHLIQQVNRKRKGKASSLPTFGKAKPTSPQPSNAPVANIHAQAPRINAPEPTFNDPEYTKSQLYNYNQPAPQQYPFPTQQAPPLPPVADIQAPNYLSPTPPGKRNLQDPNLAIPSNSGGGDWDPDAVYRQLSRRRPGKSEMPAMVSTNESTLFDSRLVIKKQMASEGKCVLYKAVYAGRNAVARIPSTGDEEDIVYAESQVLRLVQSPYTVALLNYMTNAYIPIPGQSYLPQSSLLVEFMNFGNLAQYLKVEPPTFRIAKYSLDQYNLVLSNTHSLTTMAAKGLSFIHNAGFVHLNFKPENILIHQNPDKTLIAKIGDFKSARYIGATEDVEQTPAYIAPENVPGSMKTIKSDIYAFGMSLLNIITLEDYASLWHQFPKSRTEKETFLKRNISNEILSSLLLSCIDVSPDTRPTSDKVIEELDKLDQLTFGKLHLPHPTMSKFVSVLPAANHNYRPESVAFSNAGVSEDEKSETVVSATVTSEFKYTAGGYLMKTLQFKSHAKWNDFLAAFEKEFDTDAAFDTILFKSLIKPIANRVTVKSLDAYLFKEVDSLRHDDEEVWINFFYEVIHNIILECSS
ncbi:hypothetical protein BC833DRAFT_575724 [Globomyces pollinis-pini]|nr:hypothetical protein BC833DRAFT_575724 [Globomyces pollinis-pini]